MSDKAFDWNPIIYFYCIYIAVILLGAMANIHANSIGAAIFLTLLYGKYWRYLFKLKLDYLTFVILLSILITIIPLASYNETTFYGSLNELIKYYALNLVLLLALTLPLTPIGGARRAWLLYSVLLTFLVLGWVWGILSGLNQVRVKGFLPNPNNFALTAMLLLFLIDDARTRHYIRFASHLIVIVMIYASKTGGALIGYAAGIAYRYAFAQKKRYIGILILLMIISLVSAVLLVVPPGELRTIDSTIRKVTLVKEYMGRIMAGKPIDYYEIIQKEKQDNTSLLWRVNHWHAIMNTYLASPIENILFGYGIGVTDIKFKLKPHNDYLRILFETGVAGFILNLLIWITLYRRMSKEYRWAVVMIAVFSFTENNYDHFPAMSLLAFYMLGSRDHLPS